MNEVREWKVGTSGFAYKEWKGGFYPSRLGDAKLLEYYAVRLSSVELNNTFYRMPRATVVQGWRNQTPDAFRFSIKASRRITHLSRLKDVEEPVDYLLRSLAELGTRLAAVLFQLPPYLRKNRERLARLLDHVAGRCPVAVEFRHASWFDEDVFELLREHGAALCCGDTDGDDLPHPLLDTGGLTYVRLRRPDYTDEELSEWAMKLRAQRAPRLFVYFKHETRGPELALRLQQLLDGPGLAPGRQPRPGLRQAETMTAEAGAAEAEPGAAAAEPGGGRSAG